jgi:predicted O-linked N-acetylglucosamine transferase (SPINDLY family)
VNVTSPAAAGLSTVLQTAVAAHRAGDLVHARALYEQVLLRAPGHFDALHLLGVVHCSTGDAHRGADWIQRALRVVPNEPRATANLARAVLTLGRTGGALSAVRAALVVHPADRELRHAFGESLLAAGEPGSAREARDTYAALLRERPDDEIARLRHADACLDDGDADAAAAGYREVLARHPEDACAWAGLARARVALGAPAAALEVLDAAPPALRASAELQRARAVAHAELGDPAAQEAALRGAVAADPNGYPGLLALGALLGVTGRVEESERLLRRACEAQPGSRRARVWLADALRSLGRPAEADELLADVLLDAPDDPEALTLLAYVRGDQRRFDDAEAVLARALEADGSRRDTLLAAARVAAVHRQDFARALELQREALRLPPSHAALRVELLFYGLHLADWSDWDRHWPGLDGALDPESVPGDPTGNPFDALALPLPSAVQRRVAERFCRGFAATGVVSPPPRAAGGRLRIGYLSGDFRRHPVGLRVADTLAHHDRSRCEVIALSYGRTTPEDEQARRRIVESVDRFVDLADVAPGDVAAHIAAAGVDVLVDLAGHTSDSRLRALARRPAPIQISWLGFPGTTGAAFVDYFVADAWTAPTGAEPQFVEQLLRLPHTFFPADRSRVVGRPLTRGEYGLPAHGPVACSFNQTFKISPPVFALWMRMLRDVPGATLWLARAEPEVAARLRAAAQSHGVDGTRLVFAPRLADEAAHLARYAVADLALDTWPYNSHSTASDALWAGCPLLTLSGESFASRVAGSLLHAAGVADLVTSDPDAFVAHGVALLGDAAARAALRTRVSEARDAGPLFDVAGFVRALEAGYRECWERHLAGQPPSHVTIADPEYS